MGDNAILAELRAIKGKLATLDNDINDPKNGVSYQLAKTTTRVDTLYSDIHGAANGLETRMQKLQQNTEENNKKLETLENNYTRLTKLLDENKRLMQELQVMQGLVHKVNKQNNITSAQVLDLTRRGMEQNLIIQGINDTIEVQDPKQEQPMFAARERCKHSVLEFLKNHMDIDIEPEDVWKAHRTGMRKPNKV